MSEKEQGSQLPRPWYISLTAVWKDAKNFKALVKWSKALQPAGNHVLIPNNCWHFTVLAIMKLNGHPAGTQNMREFAGRVFETMWSDNALLDALRGRFKPFTAKMDEVLCFDNGMTLQFDCGEPLRDFRNAALTIFGPRVSSLDSQYRTGETGRLFREAWRVPLVESILDDPKKNYGTRAFGSIARSPCRSDRNTERWRKPLDGVSLAFSRIHLLVSDEALTNPRRLDEEDVLIEPLSG